MDELEKIRGEVEKVIPTTEFNALLGKVSGNFEKLIGKTKMRSLAPMLLIFLTGHDSDGKRTEVPMMLTSLPDGDEKRKLLFAVGGQIADKGLQMVACFMACEAWVKTMTQIEGWRSKSIGLQQPSKCPDRTEAVVIWGRTIDSRTNMAFAKLGRGKGDMIKLGRWDTIECKSSQGKGESVEDNMLSHLFAGYLIGMAKRIGGGNAPRS
jgi:hypothetical protein